MMTEEIIFNKYPQLKDLSEYELDLVIKFGLFHFAFIKKNQSITSNDANEVVDILKNQLNENKNIFMTTMENQKIIYEDMIKTLTIEKQQLENKIIDQVHDMKSMISESIFFKKDTISKGKSGELLIRELLDIALYDYEREFEDVSKESARGDLIIKVKTNKGKVYTLLIEVKNKGSVTNKDIEKFDRDITINMEVCGGLMICINEDRCMDPFKIYENKDRGVPCIILKVDILDTTYLKNIVNILIEMYDIMKDNKPNDDMILDIQKFIKSHNDNILGLQTIINRNELIVRDMKKNINDMKAYVWDELRQLDNIKTKYMILAKISINSGSHEVDEIKTKEVSDVNENESVKSVDEFEKAISNSTPEQTYIGDYIKKINTWIHSSERKPEELGKFPRAVIIPTILKTSAATIKKNINITPGSLYDHYVKQYGPIEKC